MKKDYVRKLLSPLFVGVLLQLAFLSPVLAEEIGEKLVILTTNDIHCSVDRNLGYTGLVAYRDYLEEIYGEEYVLLVDAGDAVQGSALGTLTKGQAIIDLMNTVEYDYFIPGNHEFDYGMAQHFVLMEQLNCHILSANFVEEATNTSVYDGFDVMDFGTVKVGFVGMTTPESFTSEFKDEDGNIKYHLGATDNGIYTYVQTAIDGALAEGADLIVGVGHLGMDSASEPWRSADIIANTYGIDIFIDGHSHQVMLNEIYQDLQGNDVILTQMGSHFDYIGEIVIDLNSLEITVGFVPEDFALTDATLDALLLEKQEEFNTLLQEVVAECEVDLLFSADGYEDDMVRLQETNLGNLVADAYRVVMGADIGIINGGGIRANLEKGTITYEDIINIHPFSNEVSSMKITGQTLLDALETGARYLPDGSGGLLQVSGLAYSVNIDVESSVITDEFGNFLQVEGEYRVHDVFVGDQPLDLEELYTVAAINYLLIEGGTGLTMFMGNELVEDRLYTDSDLLIYYIRDILEGVVGEEYANPDGSGRITLVSLSDETSDVVEQPEVTVPEVVAPEVVTPEVVAPEVVAPEVVAPEVVAPEVVAPEVVAPEVVEPEVVAPEVVVPEVAEVPVSPLPVCPNETSWERENRTYIVQSGDNLSRIARIYLGDANKWRLIYVENKDLIQNPNLIYVGQVLQLPVA